MFQESYCIGDYKFNVSIVWLYGQFVFTLDHYLYSSRPLGPHKSTSGLLKEFHMRSLTNNCMKIVIHILPSVV